MSASSGAGALLIGIGADLRYLTGYTAHPLERLTCSCSRRRAAPRRAAARGDGRCGQPRGVRRACRVIAWDETDDPYALVAGRSPTAGVGRGGAPPGRSGAWSSTSSRCSGRCPGRGFGLATEVTRELRMVKVADEVELLRAAAHAADRVVCAIAAGRLVGRTEADVSREVRERLIAEGHEAASFAIVASGPNSASPHHDAGRPGHPARRPDRARHRRHRSTATAPTSPGRCG